MVFEHVNGELFFVHKILMRMGGLWPLDRHKSGSLIAFGIFCVVQLGMMLLCAIAAHDVPPPMSFVWAASIFQFFLRLTSGLSIRICGNQLARLIESTIDDWEKFGHRDESEIMKRCNGFGKSYFIATVVFYQMITTVSSMKSLVEILVPEEITTSDHEQTVSIEHTSSVVWSVSWSVWRILGEWISLTGVGTTMLWWSLSMHLSGQFKILKGNFEKFPRIRSKDESRVEFRRLVDRHNELLRLSDVLKETFNFHLGTYILFHLLQACWVAVEVAREISNGDLLQLAGRVLLLTIVLWTQFVLHEAGEYLSTCSEEIGDVLRQCEWYDLSKESIKNFSIVISQTKKPVILKVWNFYKLNRENFANFVQFEYSYITFMVGSMENEYQPPSE